MNKPAGSGRRSIGDVVCFFCVSTLIHRILQQLPYSAVNNSSALQTIYIIQILRPTHNVSHPSNLTPQFVDLPSIVVLSLPVDPRSNLLLSSPVDPRSDVLLSSPVDFDRVFLSLACRPPIECFYH